MVHPDEQYQYLEDIEESKVYEVSESDRFRFTDALPEIEPLSDLAELVFLRTYSRDGERFEDSLKRVVEGSLTAIKRHQRRNGLSWDDKKGNAHGLEFYRRMGERKLLPPGRGLWAMGTELVEKIGSMPLVNCAFVSTENSHSGFNPVDPFVSAMDLLMCGVGVGFDCRGSFLVYKPDFWGSARFKFKIPDSREGWCEALRLFLSCWLVEGSKIPIFDFSGIRKDGEPIKSFGGVSAGPKPLIELFESIEKLLTVFLGDRGFRPVNSQIITDLFNMLGKCVVSGNVRRSAEIGLGYLSDTEFLDLKDPTALNTAHQLLNDESTPAEIRGSIQRFIDNHPLNTHRWASNNSVIISSFDKPDYNEISRRIIKNGEPGTFWVDNVRFNQMSISGYPLSEDPAIGVNPCGEIPLEDHEICNVMDTFPANHETLNDWLSTLKFAYIYCKSVTLIPTHLEKVNRRIITNRRIGISVAGMSEFFDKHSLSEAKEWLETGYKYLRDLDKTYSRWLGVCESIRLTTVKPGGTIPLLTGLEGGLKIPTAKYYKRAIRISKNSQLVQPLKEAGFIVEDSLTDKTAVVVYFPCESNAKRFTKDIPLWEQASRLTILQTLWADNAVSVTLNFQPHEQNQIASILEHNQHHWKSVSFLPYETHGYLQAPYTEISRAEYDDLTKDLKKTNWESIYKKKEAVKDQSDSYCSGDLCVIPERVIPEKVTSEKSDSKKGNEI